MPMMKSTISFCINIKRKSNSIHLLTEGEFSCNFLVYRPEKEKKNIYLSRSCSSNFKRDSKAGTSNANSSSLQIKLKCRCFTASLRPFWVQRYLYSYKKHQNFEKKGKVWGTRRSKSGLIQQFPSSPDRTDVTEVSIESNALHCRRRVGYTKLQRI